ncbi:hypothetical protein Ga0074812_105189 [Parafrankia irregularis]|uniref:Uncharacterized protein n=1 Tax=Parafrankia irregularis TaxID=795642 RepID=A0A0S4QJ24_9ACTN|nr:hypothetical protein Ga0074812_105189 [Parafrankia irregularis]
MAGARTRCLARGLSPNPLEPVGVAGTSLWQKDHAVVEQ